MTLIMMAEVKQRGGARKGAGRKPQPDSEKRVAVTLSVSPETRILMNALKRKQINISRVFDDSIKTYCEANKIVPQKQDDPHYKKKASSKAKNVKKT